MRKKAVNYVAHTVSIDYFNNLNPQVFNMYVLST